MSYDVRDLIDKAIDIGKKRVIIYNNIGSNNSSNPSIKIVSEVLSKKQLRTIEYYELLKKEIKVEDEDEIDFLTFDKLSFLVNEFNQKKYIPKINNAKEFLIFSLNLEEDINSLFIDLQGRLMNSTKDINSKCYNVLAEMINYKVKTINGLKDTLK
jgi:hypothetical protein